MPVLKPRGLKVHNEKGSKYTMKSQSISFLFLSSGHSGTRAVGSLSLEVVFFFKLKKKLDDS